MNAIIQSLRYYFEVLLNSPHHLVVYVAAAAVLLIAIPLIRLLLRRRRVETVPNEVAYPSMLGLSSAVDFEPAPVQFVPGPTPIPPRNVTAINGSLTIPCIHCGVNMSSRQDFCPACGYAQPMKQSFTA
jgi:hypothetical protein